MDNLLQKIETMSALKLVNLRNKMLVSDGDPTEVATILDAIEFKLYPQRSTETVEHSEVLPGDMD